LLSNKLFFNIATVYFGYDLGIHHCNYITEVSLLGDITQQMTQDFTTAGFRKLISEKYLIGA